MSPMAQDPSGDRTPWDILTTIKLGCESWCNRHYLHCQLESHTSGVKHKCVLCSSPRVTGLPMLDDVISAIHRESESKDGK